MTCNAVVSWLSDSSPSDWIMGISTLFLALAATSGLSTWKREIYGKSKHKAASDILYNVLMMREALERIRDPLRHADDFSDSYKLEKPVDWKEKDTDKREKLVLARLARERSNSAQEIFRTRFNRATEAGNNLQSSLVEAEVALDDEFMNLAEPIYELYQQLYFSWHDYTTKLFDEAHPPPEGIDKNMYKEKTYAQKGLTKWKHEKVEKEDDGFVLELENVVNEIKTKLEKYLGRKR